jgi:hypothetical protein
MQAITSFNNDEIKILEYRIVVKNIKRLVIKAIRFHINIKIVAINQDKIIKRKT